MHKVGFFVGVLVATQSFGKEVEKPKAVVVPHTQVQSFEHRGNKLQGIATKAKGSNQFEVWHASIAANSSTPPEHKHETEEVFIFLKGKGRAIVGGVATAFEAPCTVILPANIPHQVINTGAEATDHFVVIGAGSKIFDHNNAEMDLPWRK